MKMKKAIAGLVASVVAISAMATTMVSAEETKTYKLTEEQWEIVSKGTSAVNDDSLTLIGVALAAPNQTDGTLTLTTNSSFDVESIAAEVTYLTTTKNDGTNTTEQSSKTVKASFLPRPNKDNKVWDLVVKNDGTVVNEGEVYLPTNTFVTRVAVSFESKAWYIASGTKSAAEGKLPVGIVQSTTGTATGQFFTLMGGFASAVQLPGKATPVASYPATLKKSADEYGKGIYLADVYASGETKLKPSFVTYANNFFKGTTDGKIILEVVGYNYPTVTDPTLGGSQAPDGNDINLNLTAATAKDFGLALNFRTTDKLVSAADVVDGKLVFNYADLTAAMGTNFTGNITDMAIKVSNAFADKYDEIRLVSFTYVKGAAVTDPEASTPDASTPDASTPGTSVPNPTTGNAPIALAVIPVALAAAAVVASKKRA